MKKDYLIFKKLVKKLLNQLAIKTVGSYTKSTTLCSATAHIYRWSLWKNHLFVVSGSKKEIKINTRTKTKKQQQKNKRKLKLHYKED